MYTSFALFSLSYPLSTLLLITPLPLGKTCSSYFVEGTKKKRVK
jgi:hypothetical protein